MIQYKIHLKTLNDFKTYANMCIRFNIAGFLEVGGKEINMYDILEIMSQVPVDSMILRLTQYTPAQLPELEQYMEEAHFLTESSKPSASIANIHLAETWLEA